MKSVINLWRAMSKRKAARPKTNPIWLVHFGQNICKQLPASYKICVFADQWEPGFVYVPVGSILVCAADAEMAKEKALEYMITLYPTADKEIAETLSA